MPFYKNLKSALLLILFSTTFFAQSNLQFSLFNTALTDNANAIIRENSVEITIESIDVITYKKRRIVTVLNEAGNRHVNAVAYYDDGKDVKKIKAIIYDQLGREIKTVKKRDFSDVSVADGFSIFNDNRALHLDYTPSSYPYTVDFTVETINTNTAFIPSWYPLEAYNVSTELSTYKIINNTPIEVVVKESNLKENKAEKISDFNYKIENAPAVTREAFSPSLSKIVPSVKATLKNFSMLGVEGVNNNWQDFGKWMDDKLLSGTQELPEEVKTEITELTKDASSPIEKAKIVYNYMQNKTRYISIQVGIGGWKPMLAEDVDRLGYGDCKGLSNYTKALLDYVGVTSYYTVVYGDSDIRDIDSDFSSLQGNHAILSIPNNDDYITLECTSQTAPFGYIANFTDDRDVLIITPEGGKIIHTKSYAPKENKQTTLASVSIDQTGSIKANVNIKSQGTQYKRYQRLDTQTEKENILYYKNYFDNIKNLKIENINLINNKDQIVFEENLKLSAKNYTTKAGNRFLFCPNIFNIMAYVPPRYKTRSLPFEIDRGFYDVDEYEILLPENVVVEALFEPIEIKNKFGLYKASIQSKDEKTLIYTRELLINKGAYTKEDYKNYRQFRLDIAKYDKSKMVLKINQ